MSRTPNAARKMIAPVTTSRLQRGRALGLATLRESHASERLYKDERCSFSSIESGLRRDSQDLVASDDKRRRSLFGPGIEESDITNKSARCVGIPGSALRVRIGRLAHVGQRFEYLAPPRARFGRRFFGNL